MQQALADLAYGLPSAPDVLIVAADPARLLEDLDTLGARCSGTLDLSAARGGLRGSPPPDVIVADVTGADDDAAVASLLERLAVGADQGEFEAVAIVPPALIDLAFAVVDTPAIRLLVEPSEAERRAAIVAAAPRGSRVSDGSADGHADGADLRAEVASIARRLAILAAEAPRAPAGGRHARIDAGTVRAIIRARRLRDQYFDRELFADPAWDMLLDLTAARLEHRDVAVSSLCIAAAVPPTTALRWIKLLTDEGIFVRRADPADKRRIFIALAEDAADAMLGYLAMVQRTGGAMI